MNWQEVVKLLRDIFTYSNIRKVKYTLEENGVHALSSEGDPDFNAENEIEKYSEEFYLNDKDLKTDFTRGAKSCQPTCDEQFPTFREKGYNNHLKDFDIQFSDITDDEMILLIDMLVGSRDVY